MIREAAKLALERRAFGSRIADFEMIRAKFARMVVSTYALESMVYLTAGLIDRGLDDYALEGACCKIFGTETVWNTINDALQIAGGNGFMEDYPFEKALRDSRVNMIFEGTNEILRVLVALSGMRDVGADLQEVEPGPEGAAFLARHPVRLRGAEDPRLRVARPPDAASPRRSPRRAISWPSTRARRRARSRRCCASTART